ncbi:Uncharacterised protein [uncultured Avibacterium sp.]|uniref:Uncharacterized protein n=1 Tax=uncultured Avibacterium sp. TaxID=1936169 RepID=A0A486XAU8_9PAST|nr:Uncharacterised protein [uncultured Avibacterium sp.]
MQQKGGILQIFFYKKIIFYAGFDDYQKNTVICEKFLKKTPRFKK